MIKSALKPDSSKGVKADAPKFDPFPPHAVRAASLWTQSILPIQCSLRVNAPGDKHEREADRVADQVIRTPTTARVQRMTCACGRPAGPDGMCGECKKRKLGVQRMTANDASQTTAPPIVHQVLRQPGRPLETAARNFMESRFGQDFGGVRVHANGQAVVRSRQ